MWIHTATDQAIGDCQFLLGGVWYPANWLRLASQEERLALGLIEVADPIQSAPPEPMLYADWTGFRLAVLGGVFLENYPEVTKLMNTYPSFVFGIQYANLALVLASLTVAEADHALDPLKGLLPATIMAITELIEMYHLALT